jgi:tRNA (cytidine/uridine-2'-O-)-methyltransferase
LQCGKTKIAGYFASFRIVVHSREPKFDAKTPQSKSDPVSDQTVEKSMIALDFYWLAAGDAAGLRLKGDAMSRAKLVLALFEPDIAANAGAMCRTCACLGVDVAFIEPAGFPFSDRRFRRSGMDYLEALTIDRHSSFARFQEWLAAERRRLVLLTTKGDAELWEFAFQPGDVLLVGRESAGVRQEVADVADARVRIPIEPPLRSLNVGIAAALALGEALRQLR